MLALRVKITSAICVIKWNCFGRLRICLGGTPAVVIERTHAKSRFTIIPPFIWCYFIASGIPFTFTGPVRDVYAFYDVHTATVFSGLLMRGICKPLRSCTDWPVCSWWQYITKQASLSACVWGSRSSLSYVYTTTWFTYILHEILQLNWKIFNATKKQQKTFNECDNIKIM